MVRGEPLVVVHDDVPEIHAVRAEERDADGNVITTSVVENAVKFDFGADNDRAENAQGMESSPQQVEVFHEGGGLEWSKPSPAAEGEESAGFVSAEKDISLMDAGDTWTATVTVSDQEVKIEVRYDGDQYIFRYAEPDADAPGPTCLSISISPTPTATSAPRP